MAEDRMKTLAAVFEAVGTGDVERLDELYAPDVIVDMTESLGPDNGIYHGRASAGAMWREHGVVLSSMTWVAERVTPVPPDTLVVATRVQARGLGSGIPVDARIGQVFRIAGGRVRYVKMYQSEAEALAAEGA